MRFWKQPELEGLKQELEVLQLTIDGLNQLVLEVLDRNIELEISHDSLYERHWQLIEKLESSCIDTDEIDEVLKAMERENK
jgi:hypothetical protein